MDVVEIAGESYEIYTKEEADNRGIEYRYWQEAEEPGEFVITDDDYVCEVRNIYRPKGSKNVVLSGGRSWASEGQQINYEEFKEVGNFCYNKPKTHMEHEVNNARTKRVINFYALQQINGVPHSKMPWDIMGKMYRPDTKEPSWTAQLLFKSKETMQEVNEEIIRILDEQGLTNKDVIQSYKELLEDSAGEGDRTNWRLTLNDIAKMRGIDKPKQKQRLLEETVDMSREIGEGIKKEKQQIKASRRQKIDEDE